MTRAPETLLAARRLLLDHLDVQPGRTVHTDLDPAEVGIVGDPAHVGGYHCGTDRVRREGGQIRDYSVTESNRDRSGLAEWACALDVGEFRVWRDGRVYDLPHLSAWIVGQCRADAPDTRDIREVIWSPDGRTVKRWDRLGKRSTGDSSHRWHTHISYHRDAIRAGRDQAGLFRRYLTSIGLLAGDLEDDMTPQQFAAILRDPTVVKELRRLPWQYADEGHPSAHGILIAKGGRVDAKLDAILTAQQGADARTILARIEQLAQEERARDEAAAARDAELADLVRQGQDGTLDAAEVLRRMGELLAAAPRD
ncbi:hypothetical protein [Micromonospora sp. NPDC023956]|uniref:hypothetical protein n=1 Tax=Micromonospora sp. NPDC023956 TaxID=3155722 RepID=UPI0033C6B1EF